MSFAQDEVNWFRWSNNQKKVTLWEDLKNQMSEHFQHIEEGSLGARLKRIKQDGIYAEYLKKFLSYSTPLAEMEESVLMDAFMTGWNWNYRRRLLAVTQSHKKNA